MSPNLAIFTCPICRAALLPLDKQWSCANKHSFDRARQGYTNLLPVQNKKSKSPGDDINMVAARSRFLATDKYQAISDRLNELLIKILSESIEEPARIIDAGCGEGYYTSRLQQALNSDAIKTDITGIDISKYAAIAAARRDKEIRWFVASSSDMPLQDNSADIILSLFSPLPAKEFHRCLKHRGFLIVAATGADHLIELRRLIYDDVREDSFNPATVLEPYFERDNKAIVEPKNVRFEMVLDDTQMIIDLFSMTPHFWRVSPERKAILDTLERLSITIDVQLQVFSVS
ncbi:MAG: methyltransferase domain-containing protein [Pseudomonadales bacterium]